MPYRFVLKKFSFIITLFTIIFHFLALLGCSIFFIILSHCRLLSASFIYDVSGLIQIFWLSSHSIFLYIFSEQTFCTCMALILFFLSYATERILKKKKKKTDVLLNVLSFIHSLLARGHLEADDLVQSMCQTGSKAGPRLRRDTKRDTFALGIVL